MAANDPTTRRLAAVIAANSFRAHPDRRSTRRRTDEVPADLVERYANEVDPARTLSDGDRAKRIAACWRRDEARRLLEAHHAGLGDGDGGAAA